MTIAQGITFHLPSRRRFIPYSWLLYAEMNEAETELYLQYNHCVVMIAGTELRVLHEGMNHSRCQRGSVLIHPLSSGAAGQ